VIIGYRFTTQLYLEAYTYVYTADPLHVYGIYVASSSLMCVLQCSMLRLYLCTYVPESDVISVVVYADIIVYILFCSRSFY
jgi:hypothetical protein